jgi:CheY-like chemotaxis protein
MGPTIELVMVVEDNKTDAWLLQRAFERAGTRARFLRAESVDQAIAYLRGDGEYADRGKFPLPGMIILDLKLPRWSGFDLLRWLRSDRTELRLLPVVVLSSSAELVDVDRAYDLGANSYLRKPHAPSEYLQLAECFNTYWLGWNEDPSVSRYMRT